MPESAESIGDVLLVVFKNYDYADIDMACSKQSVQCDWWRKSYLSWKYALCIHVDIHGEADFNFAIPFGFMLKKLLSVLGSRLCNYCDKLVSHLMSSSIGRGQLTPVRSCVTSEEGNGPEQRNHKVEIAIE